MVHAKFRADTSGPADGAASDTGGGPAEHGNQTLTVDVRFGPARGRPRPGDLVIVLAGELDVATETLLTGVTEAAVAHHRPANLHLDLGAVTFLDARGIAAILACRGIAVAAGAEFTIAPGSASVRRVLSLGGLDGALPGGTALPEGPGGGAGPAAGRAWPGRRDRRHGRVPMVAGRRPGRTVG